MKKAKSKPKREDLDHVRLRHELQAYQTELEAQNEELRASRQGAEQALEKYSELYDFSPVGMLSLDQQGHILECNIAAAELLRSPRAHLIHKSLSTFTLATFHPALEAFIKKVLASHTKRYLELELRGRKGESIHCQLVGLSLTDTVTQQKQCRIALVDISLQKQRQDEIGKLNLQLSRINQGLEKEIAERKQAEEERERLLGEVRAERDRISALVASIPDEVWFTDKRKRFTLANPAALKEFELDNQDSVGVEELAARLEVLRPDGSPRPIEDAPPLRALKGEVVINEEETIRTPATGQLRYRQVSAMPVRDKHGQIIGSVSVVRDITEIKKAQEALRQSRAAALNLMQDAVQARQEAERISAELRASQERLNAIYTSMTEGLATHEIVYRDGKAVDYIITEVNPAFEQITGVSARSALGKKASELYGTGSPPYLDIYAEVASEGTPHQFETYFPPMKKYFAVSVFSPGKGKFATVFTDISERKRAENELRTAKDRLELAQKSAGVGIWDWDVSTGKLDWSPQLFHLFGLDPETSESSFEIWRGIVHPKDVKAASDKIDEAVKNHTPLASEFRVILPSGRIRWITALGSAIYDDKDQPLRMSGICIDVTERKQAEQAIRDKEEELNTIYESAPLVMLLVDGERKVRKANKSAQDFGGASSSDLLGLRAGQVLRCVYSSDDPKGCGFGPNCEECTIRRLVDSTLQTGRSYTDVEAGLSLIATAGEKVRDQTFLLSTSRLNIRGEPLVLITLQDITARKQAEDLLRVSEERQRSQAASLQALLDAAPMVIWIAQDRECRNIYGNRFAQELLRVPEGTNMSKSGPQPESVAHFRVLKDGKELAPEEMPIQRVAGSGRGLTDATIDIVFDDGTVRTLLGNVAPLFDSQGTPNGAIASFVDVTERNRAQNALRKSERDLERAQAVAHIGSWKLDLQQNALLWSDETHRIFGIPKGQPLTYETFLSSVHPDDREFVEQAWKAALRGERYDIEHRIVVGNGVKWVREQAEFDFDKEGILRAAFGTVRDITRRKLAELELTKLTAELRKERDILEIIKEHANAHLAYLDPDFNFVRVNSMYARGVGYRPDELIGKNYFDLFPDEQNRGLFRKVKNMGEPIEFKAKPVVSADRPEGGVTYWDWALTPVKDDSGRVIGLELSMIDITDMKRAEEEIKALNETLEAKAAELAASNKELEAFSYSVSHDLRAPLRNIDGFSQALLEDYSSQLDEKGKDFLKRVRAATQRMGVLIDDLLSLSVTMRKEMRREKVDLSELAVGITKDLKERQPKRKVEVMIQGGALVSGDPRLLEEMLSNLLRNAWKFTSKRSPAKIEFGHIEENGEKLFYVRDNGAGFDMKYAGKLFVPFQRLHSLSEFSGNGIGLAIVKRIIDRHGGSIWAEGETDKGATFYFKLQPIERGRENEQESHPAG